MSCVGCLIFQSATDENDTKGKHLLRKIMVLDGDKHTITEIDVFFRIISRIKKLDPRKLQQNLLPLENDDMCLSKHSIIHLFDNFTDAILEILKGH